VSLRLPPNSNPLRAMACCFCCLLAASALGLLPSAPSSKSAHHSRTTGSLECRAPACPARWQDASSLWTRWIQRESSGARVARRAPETIWSYRPSVRRCEVARGRCNGRSCTYSSGPETFVPLSPTHRPSACTWTVEALQKAHCDVRIQRVPARRRGGFKRARNRSLVERAATRLTRSPPGSSILDQDLARSCRRPCRPLETASAPP
jgi:hypothetical protein